MSVATQGEDSLRQLEQDVRDLAQQGNAAAPELQAMADKLQQANDAARQMAATQAATSQQLAQAKIALADSRDALSRYRLETDDATKKTDGYREQVRRLALQVLDSRAAVRNLAGEYGTASTNAQKAARDAADLAQQLRAAATAARASGDAVGAALGTVGADTARNLSRQIKEVREAMELLRTSGSLAGPELQRAMAMGADKVATLERQLREATGQMTGMDRALSALRSGFGQLAAVATIGEAVRRLAGGFVSANVEAEALKLGLNAVYGSAQTTGQQIDFLQRTANAAGVSVGSLSQEFVKFSASTRSAGIPLQQTNDLFQALTGASASTRASVNVASERDRSTLISVLRQLETQSGRAT